MENKYCYKYPHPAVTTDCVIFGFDGQTLNVLLIRRGIKPFHGKWALPGGFIKVADDDDAETAEECAIRELKEETDLTANYIEQFHTYSDVNRDPRERVITIAFFALVNIREVKGGDDAAEAGWFPISRLPELAFDHATIIHDALKCLKERIHFSPIGYDLLPKKFTMRQLQNLYECILDVSFDRRNFAKKIQHLDFLIPLDETVNTSKNRPATLYSFNHKKYEEMKDQGFFLEFVGVTKK